MTTLTRERLEQLANFRGAPVTRMEEQELARIALAVMQQDPVAVVEQSDFITAAQIIGNEPRRIAVRALYEGALVVGDQLYAAPLAPVVPEVKCDDDGNTTSKFDHGWNTCRAAMLQGKTEHVSNRDELNSPVVQDGWVMVPVEPTEHMVVEGFESEPDEFFSDEKEWEAYDAMSGCQQAAHRAKLCWAAMIAAAPQQEVK